MRFLLVALLAVSAAGCNSSSRVDALDLGVSNDIVGSVRPLEEVPGLSEAEDVDEALTALAGDTPMHAEKSGLHFPGESRQTVLAMATPNRPTRQKVYPARFGDAKPVKFKGASPHPFEVHGVDVSKYQGNIDWEELRRHGASFAFIKATEGDDHKDVAFQRNWRGAAEAGIPRGAYHFYWWCSPAKSQAAWFIRNVPKEKGALPPVIDVEWNAHSRNCRKRPPRPQVLSEMKTFMDILERHYGQKPIIYTAPDFYDDNLEGRFDDYSFWLRSVAAHPSEIYDDRGWAFWQYSGTGLSNGVDGKIDLNVFNGTQESWHRWLKGRAL